MSNEPTIHDFERRMRAILEEQVARAADMKELQREITSAGFSHRALKRIVRALIAADDGNPKPLAALREDAGDTSLYLDKLAPEKVETNEAA